MPISGPREVNVPSLQERLDNGNDPVARVVLKNGRLWRVFTKVETPSRARKILNTLKREDSEPVEKVISWKKDDGVKLVKEKDRDYLYHASKFFGFDLKKSLGWNKRQQMRQLGFDPKSKHSIHRYANELLDDPKGNKLLQEGRHYFKLIQAQGKSYAIIIPNKDPDKAICLEAYTIEDGSPFSSEDSFERTIASYCILYDHIKDSGYTRVRINGDEMSLEGWNTTTRKWEKIEDVSQSAWQKIKKLYDKDKVEEGTQSLSERHKTNAADLSEVDRKGHKIDEKGHRREVHRRASEPMLSSHGATYAEYQSPRAQVASGSDNESDLPRRPNHGFNSADFAPSRLRFDSMNSTYSDDGIPHSFNIELGLPDEESDSDYS